MGGWGQRCRGRWGGKHLWANTLHSVLCLTPPGPPEVVAGARHQSRTPRVALCCSDRLGLSAPQETPPGPGRRVALCAWWGHSRGPRGPSVCQEGRCFFLPWTVLGPPRRSLGFFGLNRRRCPWLEERALGALRTFHPWRLLSPSHGHFFKNTTILSYLCIFERFYSFILDRGKGREGNTNVWLLLVRPLLGT